jgi:uncharacterized protein
MTIRTLTAALCALALATPSASAEDETALILATGGEAGVYFPLGNAMAAAWTARIPGISVEAEPTGGSVANVGLVQDGEAHLALVQTDIAHYAFAAEEMFEGEDPHDGYRALALLYPEQIQIVTLESAGIASVADLEGRRVAVGARGSGTEINARQILEAHDLDYDAIAPSFLGFAEAATALGDGMIDAAFLTAGAPTAAVADLAGIYGYPVALVPLEAERVEELVERWPFYIATTIPADTYPGTGAVETVSVTAMLIARADLPDDVVDSILDVLQSDPVLHRLCAIHPRGCDIRDGVVSPDASTIPLHPGAEGFFARSF